MFDYKPVYFLNNLMAKANKIIPNTFLRMAIPPAPNIFSTLSRFLKTMYTMITFKKMAVIIETILYSALIDKRVVSVPVPAINGNAKGITEAAAGMVSFEI